MRVVSTLDSSEEGFLPRLLSVEVYNFTQQLPLEVTTKLKESLELEGTGKWKRVHDECLNAAFSCKYSHKEKRNCCSQHWKVGTFFLQKIHAITL